MLPAILLAFTIVSGVLAFLIVKNDRTFAGVSTAVVVAIISGFVLIAVSGPMRGNAFTEQLTKQGYSEVNVNTSQNYFTGTNKDGKYCQGWFLADGDQVKAIWALACYDTLKAAP